MSGSTLVYALLAGLLPSLIWLWFWTREDEQPEPRWLLISTFAAGMIVVLGAIFLERYIGGFAMSSSLRYTLWAAVEEICKFIAVAVVALNSDYNDEPIDAMVYCIIAALGFSALENTLFLLEPLAGGAISESIMTGNMRFMGATLVHVVSSALVGFSFGLAYYRSRLVKVIAIVLGLSAAITLHTAFNLSIINASTAETLKIFAWVWGAVVILIILFEEVKAVRPKLS